MRVPEIRTKRDLVEYVTDAGNYYFSKGSMRWFNSRLLTPIIQRDRTVFFLTSERFEFHPFGRPAVREPRKYSIRKMEIVDGERPDIQTLGEFQGYASARDAKSAMLDYIDCLDATEKE